MKKIFFLLVFCFLAIGAWIAFSPTHPCEECQNVFSSHVYTNYKQQLQQFLQQHPLYEKSKASSSTAFNIGFKTLLEEIETIQKSPQEQRISHEAFVKKLRTLAVSPVLHKFTEEEKDSRQLFEDIIRWSFLQANMQSEMQKFLYHYTKMPPNDLLSYLEESQKTLHDQFSGLEYESSHEDQFLHGNLPSFISLASDRHETKLIRLGQPLKAPFRFLWWLSPVISPEFHLFLQLQPSHLYVNVMKREGVEGSLTQALEQLETQIPNLYVVTLDKNSSFYWQDEQTYPGALESETFKTIFLENMCASNGDFFWSRHLDLVAWQKELHHILDDVHQTYFHHQLELDHLERQDFIELTYLAILDRLVEKWHPASMNITCKQGVDRGPSLVALWMLRKNQLKHEEIATLLLTPPLMIRNRASHASRIQRFVSAAKRFPESSEKAK